LADWFKHLPFKQYQAGSIPAPGIFSLTNTTIRLPRKFCNNEIESTFLGSLVQTQVGKAVHKYTKPLISIFLLLAIFTSSAQATTEAWSTTISKASLLSAQGDFAGAEKSLNQALTLSSQPYMQYATHLYLGDIYESRRAYSQAKIEYAKCETMQHKFDYLSHGLLQDHLAQMYKDMGNAKEAEKATQASQKIEESDSSNAPLVKYVAAFGSTLKTLWAKHPINSPDKKRYLTTCNWLLDRTGHFNFIHVSKSSGNEQVDKSALTALESMPPGSPPPMGKQNFIEVEFTFAYNTPN
jgi:tetratricopeptide (TPR) repeat protein